MLKAIAKTIVALNTNVRKEQLASGFSWGILLALIPTGNLLWVFIFFISLFPKNNYGFQLLALGVGKLLVGLLSAPLDAVGYGLLTIPALGNFFTYLYNLPLAPLTRFNNSLVMGGLVSGILLWVPLFLAVRALIPLYRNRWAPRMRESKAYKAFIKLPLISALAKAVSAAASFTGVAP
jgi:uncharacterized protein (TIGR03546 family)